MSTRLWLGAIAVLLLANTLLLAATASEGEKGGCDRYSVSK